MWATKIILLGIWTTLDLTPDAINKNMNLDVNLAGSTSKYFQKAVFPSQ